MDKEIKEGWGSVYENHNHYCLREFHYFVNKQSLCCKWLKFENDPLTIKKEPNNDDCKICIRLLKKREKNETNK